MNPSDNYHQYHLYGAGPPDLSLDGYYPPPPQPASLQLSQGLGYVPDPQAFQNPLAPYFPPPPQQGHISLNQLPLSAPGYYPPSTDLAFQQAVATSLPQLSPSSLSSNSYGHSFTDCAYTQSNSKSYAHKPSSSRKTKPSKTFLKNKNKKSSAEAAKPVEQEIPCSKEETNHKEVEKDTSSDMVSEDRNMPTKETDTQKSSPEKSPRMPELVPETLTDSPSYHASQDESSDDNPALSRADEGDIDSSPPVLDRVELKEPTCPEENSVSSVDPDDRSRSPLLAHNQPVASLIGEKPLVKAKVPSVTTEELESWAVLDTKKRYKCRVCSYSSRVEVKMFEHIEAHKGKMVCQKCSKAFTKKCDLDRHMESHKRGKVSETQSDSQEMEYDEPPDLQPCPFDSEKVSTPLSEENSKDTSEFHLHKPQDTKSTESDDLDSTADNVTSESNMLDELDKSLLVNISQEEQAEIGEALINVSAALSPDKSLISPALSVSSALASPPLPYLPNIPTENLIGENSLGMTMYKCHLCSYNGRSWKSYVKHYRAHKQSYKMCHLCSRAFERPSDLKRHLERHELTTYTTHGTTLPDRPPDDYVPPNRPARNKVYHCKQCDFSSPQSQKLALHVRINHSGWHHCDICQQRFISRKTLETHKAQRHPTTILRIDTYQQSVITGTRVVHFEIEEGNNEITVTDGIPSEENLNYGNIPHVSKSADLRTILHQNKQTQGLLPNYISLSTLKSTRRIKLPHAKPPNLVPCTSVSVPNDDLKTPSLVNDNGLENDLSWLKAIPDTQIPWKPLSPGDPEKTTPVKQDPSSQKKIIILHKPLIGCEENEIKLNTQKKPLPLPENIVVGNSTSAKNSPHERKEKYVCERCNYATNVEEKYNAHLKAHSGRYICKVCKKACIKSSDLFRHWVSHNVKGANGEYICDSCEYTSPNKHDVSDHMRKHYYVKGSPQPPLVFCRCAVCKKMIPRNNILKHKEIVHGIVMSKQPSKGKNKVHDEPWEPATANGPLSPSEDFLGSVLLQHAENEKKKMTDVLESNKTRKEEDGASFTSGYSCSFCGDIFTSMDHLRKHHDTTHKDEQRSTDVNDTQESGFLDDDFEDDAFLVDDELDDDDEEFRPGRSRKRRLSGKLSVAKKRKSKMRGKHKCKICQKTFNSQYYVIEHMKLHLNQKQYTCEDCGAEFALKNTYARHIKKKCSQIKERSHVRVEITSGEDFIQGDEDVQNAIDSLLTE